ncbi:kelch domain-containing protein 2 [Scleropages formosus]|uniref:Kelch domain containing 2 n=1 Tax=Scleropages formosus TaxID=113540 RepID=A0A8C9S504_SCLFO|nr:kelch domain-containing protein 2 [Scleropages formosus]
MAEEIEEIADHLNMENDDEDEVDGAEGDNGVLDAPVEEDEDGDLLDQELLTAGDDAFEPDAPAERSGHIAVSEGIYMYVWGGYKNTQTAGFLDFYLPRSEIWKYNTETGRWTRMIAEGDVPPSMSGSCAMCVDGVLYLFGGHHARGNTNQFYRLPLMTSKGLRWEKMRRLKGLAPTCKDKLGCWVYQNRLVYFGGYGYAPQGSHLGTFEYDETSFWANGAGRGWNNHIHVLELEALAWSQPVTKGNPPSPRAAHACATVGNRGYVFGGRYREHRLNDLYYINMDTWEWSEMSVSQQGPLGRSWHSFIPVSTDHIFLFGGFTTDRQTLSDAWLYCISRNEWKPYKHSNTESPRLWHTACYGPDGEVFVFGGCANNLLSHQRAAHSNEVLIFTVQPKSLVRCCVEAVLQHRERLAGSWDHLPKHLLHRLMQRLSGINTLGS